MRHYRTPGNSEFVEALGWCLWNFLYLEEAVVRWLWLLKPDVSLAEWRMNHAFGKGVELGRAIKYASIPDDFRADVQAWLRQYETAVQDARNVVAHGHAFTVSHDPETGAWEPGFSYTDRDGNGQVVARSPEELHEVAGRIEALMIGLTEMEGRLQAVLPSADQRQLGE